MDFVENQIHHLSPNQIKALFLLAKSEKGIISSTKSAKKLGKKNKALGGIFSSLSRRKIRGESLIIPWGRPESNKGLRWKLNTRLISKEKLLQITRKLLA